VRTNLRRALKAIEAQAVNHAQVVVDVSANVCRKFERMKLVGFQEAVTASDTKAYLTGASYAVKLICCIEARIGRLTDGHLGRQSK
jgi:hypothetical protein